MASIFLTAAVSLLLYITGFFVILTPLPLMVTALRRGWTTAVAATVLGLFFVPFLYLMPTTSLGWLPLGIFSSHLSKATVASLSLIYFFYYVWMALLMSFFSTKKISLEKSFLIMVGLSVTVPALLLWLFSLGTEFHPIVELRESLRYVTDQMALLQGKSGLSEEQVIYVKQYAPAMIENMIQILPALAINFTLVVLSLNLLFLKRWFPLKQPFPGWVDFTLWKLPDFMIWLPIGIGFIYFLNLYLLHSSLVGAVILNVLLVLGAVYFFQGLAVMNYYFRNRLSSIVRLLIYFVILLFIQLVGVVIVALGLFDFWFDFRKLKRVA